jgi:ribosomal protein S18 acetylase RimI-like enzyme
MRSKWIGLVALGLVMVLGGGYYWYQKSSPIKPYEASRDRAFIINLFKKDWYWLISDYSPDYNVEFMLDKKSPTQNSTADVGKLIIKTYVENGVPMGFVAYYTKELKVGQLLFLAVDERYRGKGIARKLMNYALKDLKSLGMLAVRMNTRSDNKRARKLYESLGFKLIWTDGAYIIYEIIL